MGRFDDAGLEGVLDVAREDVQAGRDVAVVVGRTQVDQRVDGVQPRVSGEDARDELERVGEGFDGQLLATGDGVGVVAEATGEFDFDRTAAREDAAVGDGLCDDVERVVDAALEFVDDVVGRATEQEGDAVGVLALDVEQFVLLVAGDVAEARSSSVALSRSETIDAPTTSWRNSRSDFLARRTARMPSLAR